MAIITTYPVTTAESGDYLLGTKTSTSGTQVNPTKNFTVSSVVAAGLGPFPKYQDNAAAVAGGLVAGQLYQTDGLGAAPLNAAGILMVVQ